MVHGHELGYLPLCRHGTRARLNVLYDVRCTATLQCCLRNGSARPMQSCRASLHSSFPSSTSHALETRRKSATLTPPFVRCRFICKASLEDFSNVNFTLLQLKLTMHALFLHNVLHVLGYMLKLCKMNYMGA